MNGFASMRCTAGLKRVNEKHDAQAILENQKTFQRCSADWSLQ
jgi:hypothetical protein